MIKKKTTGKTDTKQRYVYIEGLYHQTSIKVLKIPKTNHKNTTIIITNRND